MRRKFKMLIIGFLLIFSMTSLLVGCSTYTAGSTTGTEILEANNAFKYTADKNAVFVDMQSKASYDKSHMAGAVNIVLSDIVVSTTVPNMLPSKEKIEKVLGNAGIKNDMTVIVYDDNNNMDSARFWWTLKVFGHEKVKVVSGGIKALKAAGAKLSEDKPVRFAETYTAKDANKSMIATMDDVRNQVNNPDKKVVLLDTRTQQEYDAGTIPSSILLDYTNNNYADGRYKSVSDIKMMYLDKKIKPDNTVIMYCKTSIRGAQTYLALYNAGFRNLKLYDGAWSEWSADPSNPVQTPTGNSVKPGKTDNS